MKSYFAPGRINLIGEHLDYNGGLVLPVAISLGIKAEVEKHGADFFSLSAEQYAGSFNIPLAADRDYPDKGEWANYPAAVIGQLRPVAGYPYGLKIRYSGDLPAASGLSASAALGGLTAYILAEHFGQTQDKRELALRCQQVGHALGGQRDAITDAYTVFLGKKNTALLVDCDGVSHQEIPVSLGDYRLVVMDTCKPRISRLSDFEARREECAKALSRLQNYYELRHLADSNLDQIEAVITDPVIFRRAKHVVSEQQRVLEAVDALRRGDIKALGMLMIASHQSLRLDYEVTGEELDALFDAAVLQAGCLGARMTGEGLGGCAIALVEATKVREFEDKVSEIYAKTVGYDCKIYEVGIGDGVRELQA